MMNNRFKVGDIVEVSYPKEHFGDPRRARIYAAGWNGLQLELLNKTIGSTHPGWVGKVVYDRPRMTVWPRASFKIGEQIAWPEETLKLIKAAKPKPGMYLSPFSGKWV